MTYERTLIFKRILKYGGLDQLFAYGKTPSFPKLKPPILLLQNYTIAFITYLNV